MRDDFANFYVEGWSVRSQPGYGFSAREETSLCLTDYVVANLAGVRSSKGSLVNNAGGWNVAVTYDSLTDSMGTIQTFVDNDTNRIVAEDILVKHFLPAIPYFTVNAKGITAAAGAAAVKTFVDNITSSATLEVSDLVAHLYDLGATYVQLPVDVTVIKYDQRRAPSLDYTQTATTLSVIERFYTIENGITYTVLT
jgi:hypothetical protein